MSKYMSGESRIQITSISANFDLPLSWVHNISYHNLKEPDQEIIKKNNYQEGLETLKLDFPFQVTKSTEGPNLIFINLKILKYLESWVTDIADPRLLSVGLKEGKGVLFYMHHVRSLKNILHSLLKHLGRLLIFKPIEENWEGENQTEISNILLDFILEPAHIFIVQNEDLSAYIGLCWLYMSNEERLEVLQPNTKLRTWLDSNFSSNVDAFIEFAEQTDFIKLVAK